MFSKWTFAAILLLDLGTTAVQAQQIPAAATPEMRLKALQERISADASRGVLKTQAITALEGRQTELEHRVAMLRSQTKPTADEQAALNQSLHEQESRLQHYEQTATPVRKVDPSSVPPTTFVTPNGTAIIAPGGMYGNSGVVIPQNGPVMSPAPANIQPVPASSATPQ